MVGVQSAIGHLAEARWPTRIPAKDCFALADVFGFTRREPVGVCGQIVPWNFHALVAVEDAALAAVAVVLASWKALPQRCASAVALRLAYAEC
jgi:acyl-CoA reductase-like NAD-dependent aldehyde dehydrogenase